MTKQNEIKKEQRRLEEIFRYLPEDKMPIAKNLIQNCAFMSVTLRELQDDIIKNGATIYTQSGNGFDTIKDNPAQKAYTTMISRYSSLVKQLIDMLPYNQRISADANNLVRFLEKGKTAQ